MSTTQELWLRPWTVFSSVAAWFYPCIKVKGILNKFIIHLLCFLFFFLKQRHISYTFIWLGVLVFNMVHLFKIKFYWSIIYRLQIISSVQFSVLNELNSHSPTLEHLYPKEFSCPFFISLHCLLSSQQALIYICRWASDALFQRDNRLQAAWWLLGKTKCMGRWCWRRVGFCLPCNLSS